MTNDPELTGDSIRELLTSVRADREARQVFLAMPREDQLLSILGMIAFLNSQLANIQKESIDYRRERERQESNRNERAMSTGEQIAIGINKALEARGSRWNKILDSIITNVTTAIVITILVLTFGSMNP